MYQQKTENTYVMKARSDDLSMLPPQQPQPAQQGPPQPADPTVVLVQENEDSERSYTKEKPSQASKSLELMKQPSEECVREHSFLSNAHTSDMIILTQQNNPFTHPISNCSRTLGCTSNPHSTSNPTCAGNTRVSYWERGTACRVSLALMRHKVFLLRQRDYGTTDRAFRVRSRFHKLHFVATASGAVFSAFSNFIDYLKLQGYS